MALDKRGIWIIFFLLHKIMYEPAHEKRYFTWVTSKGSGEPAHKRRLARAFAVHRHVVEAFRKLQTKTRVGSPNRGLCMCI